MKHYQVTYLDSEHILLALFDSLNKTLTAMYVHLEIDVAELVHEIAIVVSGMARHTKLSEQNAQLMVSPRVKEIVDLAQIEANRLGDHEICPAHIFIATLVRYQNNNEQKMACARLLSRANITPGKARHAYLAVRSA